MNLYLLFTFLKQNKQQNIINNNQQIINNTQEAQRIVNDTQEAQRIVNNTQETQQMINQKEIIISLKPHTKFYPIVHPKSETFVLPHQTQVIIRNGFTFKLISNNLIHELGPIEFKKNTIKNDCGNFKINPKSITIKKGTPYVNDYETITTLRKAHNDEYYCLALGTQITLPQGTIFNNGVDLIKLKNDTLVTVA